MTSEKPAIDGLRIDRSRSPSRERPGWLIPLLLIVAIGGGAAFWWIKQPKAEPVQVAVVREVSGASGQRTLLNASGYVTARRSATVSSKVTGKVVEVMVEEGMKVEAGQVLARIDDVNVRTGLRLSEAQLESARQALKETKEIGRAHV